jgi:hypothetical protein
MPKEVGEQRRHRREATTEKVSIGWSDSSGTPRNILGKCLDTSAGGLRIQLTDEVAAGTTVFVRAVSLGINQSARVRYCRRKGLTFIAGLEFTTM